MKRHVIMFYKRDKIIGKVKAPDDTWQQLATGLDRGQEEEAEKLIRDAQRQADLERARLQNGGGVTLTVRTYVERWLEERKASGDDWKKDRGNLRHHILPHIGDRPLAEVTTQHIVNLIRYVRTHPSPATGEPVAQRTVYNIYTVACAVFRDAAIAGLIDRSPCSLTERQLGPKRDKDPEWRQEAVFTRDEASMIISSLAIPVDRRVAYAFELLAGLRPSEVAALRWRHYEPAKQPLGSLFVAISFSSRHFKTKSTKTETSKHIPVHQTLAAILAEWRLAGWAKMMGRAPTPDDLIVPMPPWDARARGIARRDAEPFRTTYYAGRRWRDEDLPALGFRQRRHYDMRATFISLALDDGADEHILETRVTHTRKSRSRSAFDGYNRGRQWEIVCREVAKLILYRSRGGDVVRLPRAAAANGGDLVPLGAAPGITDESGSGGGVRRGARPVSAHRGGLVSVPEHDGDGPQESSASGEKAPKLGAIRSACDIALAALRATVSAEGKP